MLLSRYIIEKLQAIQHQKLAQSEVQRLIRQFNKQIESQDWTGLVSTLQKLISGRDSAEDRLWLAFSLARLGQTKEALREAERALQSKSYDDLRRERVRQLVCGVISPIVRNSQRREIKNKILNLTKGLPSVRSMSLSLLSGIQTAEHKTTQGPEITIDTTEPIYASNRLPLMLSILHLCIQEFI